MNPQAKRLLLLLLLVLLGQSPSGLFVQAYMWERGGDLAALSQFNLAAAIASALAFLLLGPQVKRGRPVLAVRLGLLLQVGFFLVVLALGAQAGSYLAVLGAINGLGVGAFWVGQNILLQHATAADDRARFWGYVSASFSATALVGPFVGSRLVAGLGAGLGYNVVFGIAALGYALAALLSMGLRTSGSDRPYLLREGLFDQSPERPWWRVLAANAVAGLRDQVLSFLPVILVYGMTGDARMMGNFSLITSAVSLVTNWAAGRFLPRQRWWLAILLSGVAQAVGALLMLANLSVTTLLLYSLVTALVGPFMGVPILSHTFDTVGAAGQDKQMERIVVREVCITIGRSAGMLLLLGLSRILTQNATAVGLLALVALAALAPAPLLGHTLRAPKRLAA